MKNRFDYIDALRGWAIIGVIVTHVSSIISYKGLLSPLTSIGGLGVQLFFLVSAFTIFYTLGRSQGKEKFVIRNFFIKRLMRIAPIYWLGIVVYTLVFGLESRGWLPGPEVWHYPLHFSFTNLLHPETPSSVVPGGWSISCEVIFYLICPLLFLLVKNQKQAFIFVLLSILSGILFLYLTSTYFLDSLSTEFGQKLSQQFFYRNIVSQLGCFSFGILLYYTLIDGKYDSLLSKKRYSLVLLLLGVICFGLIKFVSFEQK